ncbi:MAG: cupin domain-containing protein [Pirellulales bacterium]|nr:cupin domain-containing protein [Pirellulales bacterium]
MSTQPARFVTAENLIVEELPWGTFHWLCRPDLVAAERLLLIRVHIPPGQGHAFHRHPEMEEAIYFLEGTGETWVDLERRDVHAGDCVHVPTNMVHATFNTGPRPLVALAILSPATCSGPMLIEVGHEEPWCRLRGSTPSGD